MPEERDVAMDSVSGKMESERKPRVFEKPLDLDDVLVNELGQLGWFQLRIIALVVVPIMMSAFMSEYIFSAAAIPHRCWIPECNENSKELKYDPDWILNAVPSTGSGFSSCRRFALQTSGTNGSLDNCPAQLFDHSKTVGCQGYVYEKNNSVVFDVSMKLSFR
ncbi:jg15629 [Pararge aegeria aegeria]|uniref:Jg15629 protein n=1 Tax=Pararge aegeria aegeria TaxID=348720 RepID=A0A8S4RWP4_9NEOP|nr:jg15629 [Pararge aegeria aegeria]